MNQEQEVLVKRLEEAGVSLRRFLKIGGEGRDDKAAFEPQWEQHLYLPEEIAEFPRWGVAGREGLVLVDADNVKMAEVLRHSFPPTFESSSPRRGLPHFYYVVEGGEVPNKILHLNGDPKGAGEIRSQNQYLVAPGTIITYKDLNNGDQKEGKYIILEDRPLAKLPYDDFMARVEPFLGADTSQKITENDMREGVDAGTRHAKGIRYATYLLSVQKLDPSTALHEMKRWNETNRPPMGERDLERMLRNASGYIKTQPEREQPEEYTEDEDDPADFFTVKIASDGTEKMGTFVPKLLGDRIKDEHHFLTARDNEEVFVYDGKVYTDGGEATIKEQVRKKLKKFAKENFVNETLKEIQQTTYVPREWLDANNPLVVTENCVLNPKTLETFEHSPEHFTTIMIPVNYDPKAKCPNFLKFLSEVLEEGNIPLIQEIFGFTLDKSYRYQKAVMMLGIGSNGKCQVKGDVVLMADGAWKKIENVKVGDVVVSPQEDGTTTHANVINTHSRFEKDVYEVRANGSERRMGGKNGLLYTCAGNHLIPIVRQWSKRTSKDDSTPRMKERRLFLYDAKTLSKMYTKKSDLSSFTTPAVTYSREDAQMNPYCLGAWLGDGGYRVYPRAYSYIKKEKIINSTRFSRSIDMTTADLPIINEFKHTYPNEIIREVSNGQSGKATVYHFTLKGKFERDLRALGLHGKKSGTKFIPKECLLSSIEYRKQLLAGLVDTDGFVSKIGQVTYTTKSKRLADDIRNLVFSLGGASRISEMWCRPSRQHKKALYYRLSIQLDFNDIPLRTWKKERIIKRKTTPRSVGIGCFKTHPQQVYGIEIDSPSHQYVTNNWMVTHNSTLLNVLNAILGENNVSTPSLQALLYDKFASSKLYHKLANIHADIPSRELKNTGLFKMLTGEDLIDAQKKHKDGFKFRNYAKLIYSCNELPKTDDLTRAFFRRWLLIKFPYIFPEGSDKCDPDLLDKITTPEELSGILNWMLEGLHRLLANGGFSVTEPSKAIEAEWIRRTDSLMSFTREYVIVDRGWFTTKETFYEVYKEFCSEYDTEAVTKATVGHRLPTIIPQTTEVVPDVEGKRTRSWKDVRVLGSKPEDKGQIDLNPVILNVTDVTEVLSYYWAHLSNKQDGGKLLNKNPVTSVTSKIAPGGLEPPKPDSQQKLGEPVTSVTESGSEEGAEPPKSGSEGGTEPPKPSSEPIPEQPTPGFGTPEEQEMHAIKDVIYKEYRGAGFNAVQASNLFPEERREHIKKLLPKMELYGIIVKMEETLNGTYWRLVAG